MAANKTTTNRKRPWGKGPVIARIKLNPEQAVLGCCKANGCTWNGGYQRSDYGSS